MVTEDIGSATVKGRTCSSRTTTVRDPDGRLWGLQAPAAKRPRREVTR
jgi:hypothetical protein